MNEIKSMQREGMVFKSVLKRERRAPLTLEDNRALLQAGRRGLCHGVDIGFPQATCQCLDTGFARIWIYREFSRVKILMGCIGLRILMVDSFLNCYKVPLKLLHLLGRQYE